MTINMRSSSGIANFGERVIVWGKDLHAECLDMSFVHYYLFCATGRHFDETRSRVLEQLWISTGYPDARLWCNRVAGYLGSARVDPALAIAASLAASNSTAYGFRAMRKAFELQQEIPERVSEREVWLDRQLAARRVLAGYGRPVRARDERVGIAYRVLAEHGLRAGSSLRRAYWLGKHLLERKGVSINATAVYAAIALDFGMTAQEYDAFMLLLLAPGYIAVYADQRRRAPLSFLAGFQSRPQLDRAGRH